MTVRCLRITVELVVDHGEGLVPERRSESLADFERGAK